ncbi:ABC transporter permease, partial [Candidatus Bipolaricaulota bacterium]|nr:ABC transporter permease [Candidatus Bipolaricaulota bacterium]
MLAYIVRRLLLLPLVLFGMSVLFFALLSALSPYERLAFYVDENLLSHIEGPEDWDVLFHRFGLDRPIHVQYLNWLGNVLRGDLGYSTIARMPVSDAIRKYFPASVELALLAAIPVLVVGIWMGFVSAERRGSLLDHAFRGIAIVGWSLPSFVAGLLLLLVFYGILPWFPPGRVGMAFLPLVRSPEFIRYTNMMSVDSLLNGEFALFLDSLRHLVLPIFTLAFLSWALLMRVARSSLLSELRQDYVTTARSKGLPERVVRRHARRNSLISVTTIS